MKGKNDEANEKIYLVLILLAGEEEIASAP